MKKILFIFAFFSTFCLNISAQDVMRLTMYHASKGSKTADGTTVTNPASQRICAMSRDMLKKYPMGTRVYVEGYGVYIVRDKMARRHKRSIDLLVPRTTKAISKRGVKVTKR